MCQHCRSECSNFFLYRMYPNKNKINFYYFIYFFSASKNTNISIFDDKHMRPFLNVIIVKCKLYFNGICNRFF